MKVPSRSISAVRRSFSASEPSHQTILAGFVSRDDSSTQFSRGVATLSPWDPVWVVRATLGQFGRNRGAAVVKTRYLSQENSRVRAGEMQGGCVMRRGLKCPMLYSPRNVRAETGGGNDHRSGAAARAAGLARQFLHAEFYGVRGIRRHASQGGGRAGSGAERRSGAVGGRDGRVVHETRKREWRGGRGGASRAGPRFCREPDGKFRRRVMSDAAT